MHWHRSMCGCPQWWVPLLSVMLQQMSPSCAPYSRGGLLAVHIQLVEILAPHLWLGVLYITEGAVAWWSWIAPWTYATTFRFCRIRCYTGQLESLDATSCSSKTNSPPYTAGETVICAWAAGYRGDRLACSKSRNKSHCAGLGWNVCLTFIHGTSI